ncbi:MAG: S9 family peptidase [Acidobacteriaceae bacterium]
MNLYACRARLPLIAAVFSLMVSPALFAQAPAKATPTPTPKTDHPAQSTPRVTQPSGVAISPDGKTVAWTLRGHDAASVHITPVADPASTQLVPIEHASHCAVSTPIWSPDGQTLAFFSNCTGDKTQPEQEQLFLWSKSSGKVSQLTHLTGIPDEPAWSPDGKQIAFLFVHDATRVPGGHSAQDPAVGVIGADKHTDVQQIDVVNAADGKNAFETTLDLYSYEFGWSPDSRHLAFIAAPNPGENNWWVAKLYTQSVQPGAAEAAVVFDPGTSSTAMHGLQMAVPRFSPDGKRIAFIGGLMSDQAVTGGDIWVVAAKPDSQPTDITPNIDGTPGFEAWLNDHTIGFVEDRRGHMRLVDYDTSNQTQTGTVLDLGIATLSGQPLMNGISATPSGDMAFVKQSANTPPEIWAGHWDALKQITHLNTGMQPESPTKSIEWTNEGFHVQGWLTYPENYNPKEKYPLIVMVHGGPSYAITSRWSSGFGLNFAHAGYFLFQPNPRGSYGQGEAFTQANRKDFGYGDLRDILAGVDAVEATAPIDKSREGLMGWSYGGFMSMFAPTQTHRFRAIVAGAGISDWLSYYGENSIDQWMIPFFGTSVYNDPAVYAKSSALTFIKQAKTPMLILVGQYDGECPAPQSFEMWHALRDLGVKTQLVVYPNEGHGFVNPKHIEDMEHRVYNWFAENMPASK